MADEDILGRVRKLLALAASPNEEEARTAALMAARLIAQHKIELRLPSVAAPRPPTRRTPRYREAPYALLAEEPGVCRQCARPFAKGEWVHTLPGHGTTHHNCQHYWYLD